MSRKFTRDMISPFTLASSFGVSGVTGTPTQYENVGNVVSRSLELSLDTRILDTHAVTWNVLVGATLGHNKLIHKAPGLDAFGTQGASFHEGFPIFGYWGNPVLSYADVNQNGILEQSEIQFGPQQFMGAPYPSSSMNYSSDLSFWNGALRLSATLTQVDGLTNPLCVTGGCGVYPRAAVDRTAPLAEQAAYIQAALSGGNYLAASSSLRLNEASMTYTVPARFARQLVHAQSLSVTFAGRNLGLWTSYAGQDPNVDTSGLLGEATSNNGFGTPQPRSWVLRFSAGY
jgi:hypothetical protein